MVVGDCRRHAPQLFQMDPGAKKPFVTKYPSQQSDEFCGSFRPRTLESDNQFSTWWNRLKEAAKGVYVLTDDDAEGWRAYFERGLSPFDAIKADTKQS
jgi:hypothetical protein